MAVINSPNVREKSLLSFFAERSEFLKNSEIQALLEVTVAELQVKVAEDKLKLAKKRHAVCRLDWEVLQLQAAHSRCPTEREECSGDGPHDDATSLQLPGVPEDWRADEPRLDQLLVGVEAEMERGREALERLGAELRAAQAKMGRLEAAGLQLEQRQQLWAAAHQHCTSRVSGEVLPESVLLEIFRELSGEILLQVVGRVCSTWRRVSRDKSLWKDTVIQPDTSSLFLTRWAPSCRKVCVEMDNTELGVYVALLERDYISNLQVIVNYGPPPPVAVLFSLLRKHQNHLKTFSLLTYTPLLTPQDVPQFWKIVSRLNLRKLRVKWFNEGLLRTKCDADFSNLRLEKLVILQCTVRGTGVISDIMSASQYSLRAVHLSGNCSASFFERLALCHNLRIVDIPIQKGIKRMEVCKEIEVLNLLDHSEYTYDSYAENIPEERYQFLQNLSSADYLPRLKKLYVGISGEDVDINRLKAEVERIQEKRPMVSVSYDGPV